jgi:hypothetical protein
MKFKELFLAYLNGVISYDEFIGKFVLQGQGLMADLDELARRKEAEPADRVAASLATVNIKPLLDICVRYVGEAPKGYDFHLMVAHMKQAVDHLNDISY